MSVRSKVLASFAVLGLLAGALATVVHSSFSATARNEGNTFQAGSVSLTDDDDAKVLWNLTGLQPSSSIDRKCVTVSYGSSGGLASAVRLYGQTSGALAPHLKLRVVRGSFAGAAPTGSACTGFTADSGGGVLFDGTLDGYPQSWANGIRDPRASWSAGDKATYQLELTLLDTDDAQGKQATHAFAFEARTA